MNKIMIVSITPIPKNVKELMSNITDFFSVFLTGDELISPRLFRVHIGVSSWALSKWKLKEYKDAKTTEKYRQMFHIIKEVEDLLLARIEQGLLNPSNKDKFIHPVGLIATLKAYDPKWREARASNANEQTKQVIQVIESKKSKKGVQSARVIKKLIKQH